MAALADDAVRERIRKDTASTLFVNAGAGSGKTEALVHRVVTLVLDDDIPMRHIAAVTFTERAGAELRDRLRERMEEVYRGADDERRARARRSAQRPRQRSHRDAALLRATHPHGTPDRGRASPRGSRCSTRWAPRSPSTNAGTPCAWLCSTTTRSPSLS